jgi:hypothetical protein
MLEFAFCVWKYYDYIYTIRTLYRGYHYYKDVKNILVYCMPSERGKKLENIEMEIIEDQNDKWCCVNFL